MEKEEEDRRREAAISSSPCLQPNFNPKGVTQDQLSKFRELHRKRLQLKSKSKFKTKPKDESKRKAKGNDPYRNNSGAQGFKVDNEEQSILNNLESFDLRNEDSKSGASVPSTSKKQKLHWGLDTKERWERKSNM
ncbi:unnamed protein product [Lathyrus oleraceus]|uniref:Uncharacterized protein n=1 Tax=Pisum sativum TaxID=3888 RepID=A0A9D5GW17_PEA|nr:uncharacterized protein LOC127123430 [Pisum sativum]KAI5443312.1 hypothetical protein KIW84_012098 [Pisum sativum]